MIAAEFMSDECLITREGVGTFNETTLAVDKAFETIYEGRCLMQDRIRARSATADGADLAESEAMLKVPAGTPNIQVGDRVEMTGGNYSSDGRVMAVIRVLAATHSFTRRVICRRIEAFSPGSLVT